MLDRRLLLVSGKGGVGKSAVTAALSILAARQGRRVLALAMTDAIGLATHLGVDDLTYEPTPLQPGLYGSAVNRSRALDEYLKLQLRMPRAMPTGQVSRALNLLVDTAPGVREIISMGKPIYEVWKDEWDVVITDAPSLGQLQSYLNAPATITDLVPAGAVQEQAASLHDTLSDPGTSGLVLITTPEELPIVETAEAIADLDADPRIAITCVAANRVLAPLEASTAAVAELSSSPWRDAGLLHTGLRDSQETWLGRLPAEPRLPFLFGLHTPAEVAAQLADEWERAL
jgi:anion-transporting  ArsA/GET3 family ATPase